MVNREALEELRLGTARDDDMPHVLERSRRSGSTSGTRYRGAERRVDEQAVSRNIQGASMARQRNEAHCMLAAALSCTEESCVEDGLVLLCPGAGLSEEEVRSAHSEVRVQDAVRNAWSRHSRERGSCVKEGPITAGSDCCLSPGTIVSLGLVSSKLAVSINTLQAAPAAPHWTKH